MNHSLTRHIYRDTFKLERLARRYQSKGKPIPDTILSLLHVYSHLSHRGVVAAKSAILERR